MIKYIIAMLVVMAIMGNIPLSRATTVEEDCSKMNVGDGKTWHKGMVFDLQEKCFNLDDIDCSNVSYSANVTETLMIMKHCTGAERKIAGEG